MVWLGASWRLILIVAVIAALMVVPLLFVHRATGCAEPGREDTRWTFVAPGGDPPEPCTESESGLEVLRDELKGSGLSLPHVARKDLTPS